MASDFKVTLLGTGQPLPSMNRFGPSTLIQAGTNTLLFDCGRGTMQRIYQIDTDASTYNKLFLTHLHSDHTTGIPDLWITGHLRLRKEKPLQIWGPTGTRNMTTHLEQAFEVDLRVRKQGREHYGYHITDEGLRFEVNEIDEGYVFDENGVRVIPFRVNHHDLYSDEPSLGYRVEYNGRSVVVSGDTCFCENLIKYSKGVDLLIHEVAAAPVGADVPGRLRVPMNHHTFPEDCGRVFSEVRPKLAVFYHVIQFLGVSLDEMMGRTMKEYDGPVIFGEDLMQISVGDTVQVINP